ncbi:MAG: dehydrogenase, partial [Pseudomonadota bacterium]|nr:dehydrogenase [Pseudomonadota bacterium]
NWNRRTVAVDGAYQATDTWHGKNNETIHPGPHYHVSGNSKIYGAALFRLRARDFEELRHKDGISPAWPPRCDTFEPNYCQAEAPNQK